MSNMYESGSLPGHFKPHQQGPTGTGNVAAWHGRAVVPVPETITDRAQYVTVNASGSYYFLYETSCSINAKSLNTLAGAGTGEIYTHGITVTGHSGPVRLDINPVAWSGSSGQDLRVNSTGDVTFVYTGQR